MPPWNSEYRLLKDRATGLEAQVECALDYVRSHRFVPSSRVERGLHHLLQALDAWRWDVYRSFTYFHKEFDLELRGIIRGLVHLKYHLELKRNGVRWVLDFVSALAGFLDALAGMFGIPKVLQPGVAFLGDVVFPVSAPDSILPGTYTRGTYYGGAAQSGAHYPALAGQRARSTTSASRRQAHNSAGSTGVDTLSAVVAIAFLVIGTIGLLTLVTFINVVTGNRH